MPGRESVTASEAFPPEAVEQSIPSRFEHQVRAHPHHLAVQTAEHAWSYEQLNRLANRIARGVLARDSAGRTPVAILLEQGAPSVAALLGVLKAGKLALLLDPSDPPVRLEQLLGEAAPTGAIAGHPHAELVAGLMAGRGAVVDLDALDPELPGDAPAVVSAPDDAAVIFYTSGSTGHPKGIVGDHRAWIHNARNYANAFGIGPGDRVTLLALGTSQAMKNILVALLNGATLYPYDVRKHGLDALVSLLARERITVSVMGASLFRALADVLEGAPATFPALRMIRLGSEPVYPSDLDLYRRHFSPHCRLVNGLASGETQTIRFFSIDHGTRVTGGVVPVGYPVEDKTVLLLDDAGQEVAPGEVGEIVVESRFLAIGYWRRPDLTDAAFQPAPAPGRPRRYRTGDLGRLEPDGALVCLGRKNARVKIRGHGVDLLEIEAALRGLDGVKEAVVVAREGRAGYAQLVAYVVPAVLPGPTNSALRAALARSLPDYVIPSTFVLLGALPRTTSGKTDRQALPAPGRPYRDPHRPPTGPSTPLESAIAEIWSSVLNLDAIDVHDHFYDLGGESLQAMRIMAKVRKTFPVDMDLQSLLEAPTIVEMAQVVGERLPAAAGPTERPRTRADGNAECHPVVGPQPGPGHPPIFFVPGGVGGKGEFFLHARLAHHVGPDHRFHWLGARSAGGREASAATVEEIAEEHVRDIRSRQAHGPYVVVGDCGGGVIAYEIAQQLRAAGEEIALLVLLDTLRPDATLGLRRLLAAFPRWSFHREALRPLSPGEALAYLSQLASRSLRAGWSLLRRGDIRGTYSRARYRYRPRPYPGPLTLMVSEDLAQVSRSLGWEEFVGGGIDLHHLRGNHVTYIRRYVDDTARMLRTCIEQARGAHSSRPAAKTASPAP